MNRRQHLEEKAEGHECDDERSQDRNEVADGTPEHGHMTQKTHDPMQDCEQSERDQQERTCRKHHRERDRPLQQGRTQGIPKAGCEQRCALPDSPKREPQMSKELRCCIGEAEKADEARDNRSLLESLQQLLQRGSELGAEMYLHC